MIPQIFNLFIAAGLNTIVFGFITSTSRSHVGFTPSGIQYFNIVERTKVHRANFELTGCQMVSDSSNDEGIGCGIDLGTTNSAVAVIKNGLPIIIPVETIDGKKATMPSVVSINSASDDKNTLDSDMLSALSSCGAIHNIHSIRIGQEAVDAHAAVLEKLQIEGVDTNKQGYESYADGSWTYRNFKRIMGVGCTTAATNAFGVVPNLSLKSTLHDAPMGKQKKKRMEHLNLNKKLEEASTNPAKLAFEDDVLFGPEHISSLILRKLFKIAEAEVGSKVTRAVIGVPAYFNDAQRDATIRACNLAGVSKVKLLREPEAAALAYGVGKTQVARANGKEIDTDDELVLVFDLGGGTFDVSILEVGGGIMEVVATGRL